jgi:hypothetical protein
VLRAAAEFVLAAVLTVLCGDGRAISAELGLSPTPAWGQETPVYDKLYREVLASEKAGRLEEALKKIPAVYGADVPVDAFYRTLEAKKKELLKALFVREGPAKDNLIGLMFQYQNLLAMPDELLHVIRIKGDLPFERFLYGEIVRKDTKRPLIGSRDPWLVSAAVFLARKHQIKVEPRDVIERWKERPDLWDETCAGQALLLLARLTPEVLKKIPVGNADIERELQKLAPAKVNEAAVEPQLFERMTRPALDLSLVGFSSRIWLEDPKAEASKGTEKDLSAELNKRGYILVPAGSYALRFVSGSAGQHGEYAGMYGRSNTFTAKRGLFIRLLVPVDSGV